MEISGLYQFVLALVLIGLVVGVGIVALAGFKNSLVTNVANCGLNASGGTSGVLYTGCGYAYNATGSTVTALATIPSTWLGLIVTIVVVSIILTLVIRSFSGSR